MRKCHGRDNDAGGRDMIGARWLRTEASRLAQVAVAVGLCAIVPGVAEAQKKTLTFGTATKDVGALDPHITATTTDKTVIAWMFSGLVRFRPGSINPEEIEPDLAASWQKTPDGKEWTFTLRKDVTCHDGSVLTSEDVVYSLNRAADKKTSQFSSDYAAIDRIEAPDAQTVKITLKTPVPGFLGYVANYHGGNIVCKKAAEAAGENFKLKPIGTGPFIFEEYRPQQSLTFRANEKYFRGAPKIERITYRYIESDASRDLGFQSGELDMVYGRQDDTWVERAKRTKGAVVVVMEPAELSTLYLNVENEQLKDIRVRQALAYAIDRKEIVQFKGATTSREAKSIVPSGYLGSTTDVPLSSYDPTRAKALLAEAGYPNGITIKIIHTNLPGMLTLIQAVQGQLIKAGINLEIDVVEHATFHAQIRKDLSPIVHYAAARYPVADVYLTQFFHSRSTVGTPTAVTNFTHCNDADAEIDAARIEPDADRQKALWRTAQMKLIEKVCAVPVYEQLQVYAYKDELSLGYDLKGSLTLGPLITEQTRFK